MPKIFEDVEEASGWVYIIDMILALRHVGELRAIRTATMAWHGTQSKCDSML